jgi:hypothetical protein
MPNRIDDPQHWHDRAAQMRALANVTECGETQEIMRRLADDYDKLGERAAKRLASGIQLSKYSKSG